MTLILLLGGPGSGKGTQGELLSARLGIPHVSSGDLLREQHKPGMETGDLLPDDVVAHVVFERLQAPDAAHGAILDGFPRTLRQAELLDDVLQGKEQHAIYLQLPEREMLERLRGRQLGRSDDAPATHERRVNVFTRETLPLVKAYEQRGMLRTVDATGDVPTVFGRLLDAVS